MLYCNYYIAQFPIGGILIFNNNEHKILYFYKNAAKYILKIGTPEYFPYEYGLIYFRNNSKNTLDIQRYLDFRERLDYLIDNS